LPNPKKDETQLSIVLRIVAAIAGIWATIAAIVLLSGAFPHMSCIAGWSLFTTGVILTTLSILLKIVKTRAVEKSLKVESLAPIVNSSTHSIEVQESQNKEPLEIEQGSRIEDPSSDMNTSADTVEQDILDPPKSEPFPHDLLCEIVKHSDEKTLLNMSLTCKYVFNFIKKNFPQKLIRAKLKEEIFQAWMQMMTVSPQAKNPFGRGEMGLLAEGYSKQILSKLFDTISLSTPNLPIALQAVHDLNHPEYAHSYVMQVKPFVLNIQDPKCLSAFIQALAGFDLEQALSLTERLDDRTKQEILPSLIQWMTIHKHEKTFEYVSKLTDESKKAQALIKMVKVIKRHDQQYQREMLDRILPIAKYLIEKCDKQAIYKEVPESIVLRKVAKAYSSLGLFKQALNTFNSCDYSQQTKDKFLRFMVTQIDPAKIDNVHDLLEELYLQQKKFGSSGTIEVLLQIANQFFSVNPKRARDIVQEVLDTSWTWYKEYVLQAVIRSLIPHDRQWAEKLIQEQLLSDIKDWVDKVTKYGLTFFAEHTLNHRDKIQVFISVADAIVPHNKEIAVQIYETALDMLNQLYPCAHEDSSKKEILGLKCYTARHYAPISPERADEILQSVMDDPHRALCSINIIAGAYTAFDFHKAKSLVTNKYSDLSSQAWHFIFCLKFDFAYDL